MGEVRPLERAEGQDQEEADGEVARLVASYWEVSGLTDSYWLTVTGPVEAGRSGLGLSRGA